MTNEEMKTEIRERIEKLTGQDLEEAVLMFRHLAHLNGDCAEALTPDELDDLRTAVDRRGLDRAAYGIA